MTLKRTKGNPSSTPMEPTVKATEKPLSAHLLSSMSAMQPPHLRQSALRRPALLKNHFLAHSRHHQKLHLTFLKIVNPEAYSWSTHLIQAHDDQSEEISKPRRKAQQPHLQLSTRATCDTCQSILTPSDLLVITSSSSTNLINRTRSSLLISFFQRSSTEHDNTSNSPTSPSKKYSSLKIGSDRMLQTLIRSPQGQERSSGLKRNKTEMKLKEMTSTCSNRL
ncbi:hypothetical protein DFH28DRAFT_1185827 [Melampsora americana]|nr:hypothetical protein DFH28DRAFT_1185827 [Melampsora americana]